MEDLLHRRGRLRALRRVLEQDRVADHQVRAREARHLVVGEVPRHDPEQDAERAAADERRAVAVEQLDRLVGQQLRRVVGVVLVDRGAEVDLAERLLDRLAHLAHDDLGEPLALLGVQLADAADERRALLDRRRARSSSRCAASARPIASSQVVVGDRRVLLDGLAGGRVDHGVVAHEFLPSSRWTEASTAPVARASANRAVGSPTPRRGWSATSTRRTFGRGPVRDEGPAILTGPVRRPVKHAHTGRVDELERR